MIRSILQKILITGKEVTPYQFFRCLHWQGEQWQVEDRLTAESWSEVVSADIGCDRTSIYVVMSRTFQPGQLQPGVDLRDLLRNLNCDQQLTLKRKF